MPKPQPKRQPKTNSIAHHVVEVRADPRRSKANSGGLVKQEEPGRPKATPYVPQSNQVQMLPHCMDLTAGEAFQLVVDADDFKYACGVVFVGSSESRELFKKCFALLDDLEGKCGICTAEYLMRDHLLRPSRQYRYHQLPVGLFYIRYANTLKELAGQVAKEDSDKETAENIWDAFEKLDQKSLVSEEEVFTKLQEINKLVVKDKEKQLSKFLEEMEQKPDAHGVFEADTQRIDEINRFYRKVPGFHIPFTSTVGTSAELEHGLLDTPEDKGDNTARRFGGVNGLTWD